MDIGRLKKAKEEALEKEKQEKEYTIAFFSNTTEYWKQYLSSLKISEELLDSELESFVKNNPKSENYRLFQLIISPRIEGKELYYSQECLGQLWKSETVKYSVDYNSEVFDRSMQSVSDYHGDDGKYRMHESTCANYLKTCVLDNIKTQLENCGLTVESMNVVDELSPFSSPIDSVFLVVVVKNPVLD